MLSDKLIQHYEDTVKKGVAPHTMHNLPLDCAVMLIEGLSASSPTGSVNVKQANNIWNFVLDQLKAKGYDPYTFKVDGFKDLLLDMVRKEITSVKTSDN